jgi:hypothetical protein
VRNELWRRARAVPSLDLRFAENKSLVDATTGSNLVTFTRASSGTFTGSDGLLQTAVTNLLLRSEELDNASWSKVRSSITANTIVAPDGTLTADKIVEDTSASATHAVTQSIIQAANTTSTFSVNAKAAERSFVNLRITVDGVNFIRCGFDLSNGTAGTPENGGNGSGAVASIQSVGNGWYRCAISGIQSSTNSNPQVQIFIATGTTTASAPYTGDGTSGIYVWGAQLEQSSTVGEYIPTTSTINSAPRFDHDPVTGESLGLLVEEQRTNLLLRSEEFDNAGWTKTRSSITANTIVAPNGTLTGDKLVEDTTASNSHAVSQGSLAFTSGTSYSLSVYVKAAGRTQLRMALPSAAFGTAVAYTFDLSAETATQQTSGTNDGGSITAVGNEWYRCRVTAQATATNNGSVTIFTSVGGIVSYTGDGFSGIYIWGAQLEVGAFPTSYIPTTTATVTRSADVASISGSNFSSWYRQDEGTVFSDAGSFTTSGNPVSFDINDGTTSNRHVHNWGTSTTTVQVGAAVQASLISTAPVANVFSKLGYGYLVNNFASTLNGGALAADVLGSIPTVNRLTIGDDANSSNFFNGHIRRLTYWPIRLPNSTLQAVTQ